MAVHAYAEKIRAPYTFCGNWCEGDGITGYLNDWTCAACLEALADEYPEITPKRIAAGERCNEEGAT